MKKLIINITDKVLLPILIVLVLILIGLNVWLFTRNGIGVLDKSNETDNNNSTMQQLLSDKKLVVLISIDGMRADMIGDDSPYLKSLLTKDDVSYTLDMLTLQQSETMPSHVSMVTGLTQEHHGFYANSVDENTEPLSVKTVFDYAISDNFEYYAFVTKEKLLYLLGGKTGDNIVFEDSFSGDVIDDIDKLVEPNNNNVFVFIHFRDMDTYGHTSGWNSIIQKAGLRSLDANLNLLVSDFESEFASYQRYFIFTADHGGEGNANASGCPTCRRIPLIVESENTNSKYVLNRTEYNIFDVACVTVDIMGVTDNLELDCVQQN